MADADIVKCNLLCPQAPGHTASCNETPQQEAVVLVPGACDNLLLGWFEPRLLQLLTLQPRVSKLLRHVCSEDSRGDPVKENTSQTKLLRDAWL